MGGVTEEYRDGECYNCGEGPSEGHVAIPSATAAAMGHPAPPWAIWCPLDRQPDGRGFWKEAPRPEVKVVARTTHDETSDFKTDLEDEEENATRRPATHPGRDSAPGFLISSTSSTARRCRASSSPPHEDPGSLRQAPTGPATRRCDPYGSPQRSIRRLRLLWIQPVPGRRLAVHPLIVRGAQPPRRPSHVHARLPERTRRRLRRR